MTFENDLLSKNTSEELQERTEEILADYRLAVLSREASLLGRREVLTGKAQFGVFGDGKEVAQIAKAKQFKNGDFRSGYYRDQTFMMAIGGYTVEHMFSGLYADTNLDREPTSGGRQMVGHFSTPNVNPDGSWKKLIDSKNTASDISCTAGQIPRLLGLAQASKVYRELDLPGASHFSNKGNEVAFGTIGDGSTSEGVFWEGLNAAGVMQVPMALSVWDDGYAISVPKKYQTTKESISEATKGLQRENGSNGIEIFNVKGHDYLALCETYKNAISICRKEHVPVLIHVEDLTQPQGHSTSGSHERYKSPERLAWMKEYDCNVQFRKWILDENIADETTLVGIEKSCVKEVREAKKRAWKAYREMIDGEQNELENLLSSIIEQQPSFSDQVSLFLKELKSAVGPTRKTSLVVAKAVARLLKGTNHPTRNRLLNWLEDQKKLNEERYDSTLYNESKHAALKVKEVPPIYSDSPEFADGRVIIRDNFRHLFNKHQNALLFGEDVGFLGDVNQGAENLQAEFGETRVSDTGIREATIVGQATGMSMRGLRPIAEIQYLDYIYYALYTLTDDVASLHYRTKGTQIAPLIIRTRGHRLEGVWHSGSPMSTLLGALRGMYLCVPSNLTDAAGFYNTLLDGFDPAVIIEPLNAYRTKEPVPSNFESFNVPLGIPKIVEEGKDITLVSYGSTFNLCKVAVEKLKEYNISVELIDLRTLVPFDINGMVVNSLKKTNRLLIVDEDVSGGASAYILDKVLVEQGGYEFLDSAPKTLSGKDHRPAYAADGDYFSKPNIDHIVDAAYEIMTEFSPNEFPSFYK